VSKGNVSDQTAGRKRKGKCIFDVPYGESANNIIGDEQAEPTSKKRLLDSETNGAKGNLERVERACKRRARILQEIKAIGQLRDAVSLPDAAVQLSSAAVRLSHDELSNAAARLSNPAIQTKLPFPFTERDLPQWFNSDGDHDHWDFMGREKCTELLDAIKELETTHWHGYWFYGTFGYGKSHLLATLACYLIAAGKRVVFIPDCQACVWKPVAYLQTAMLLAWGARMIASYGK
jgi:hypothetical protein